MIILGLGANDGECLVNLRAAVNKIKTLPDTVVTHISPVYFSDALLPENAPLSWNKPFFNCAIAINCKMTPRVLLQKLKNIEIELGRNMLAPRWSPRLIDIDILVFNDIVLNDSDLTLPHPDLINRPFALWPLADIYPLWRYKNRDQWQGKTAAEIVEKWGSRFTAEAPFKTRQIYQRIAAPQLVGIINVTPDSFSDGNPTLTADAILAQAKSLIDAGAEILDIGAESTSPTATPIDMETEWQRLQPILEIMDPNTFFLPPKLSVDTRRAEIAKRALTFDVDWINDVTGGDDEAMQAVIRDANCEYVIMHHKSIPERRNDVLPRNEDPVMPVLAWGRARINELMAHGIKQEKIIFDPGIGFGKMAEQSLLVLQHVSAFKELGVRIFIGQSRKTFLSLFTHAPFAERDIETVAISQYLATEAVDYVRVHNVAASAKALRLHDALHQGTSCQQSATVWNEPNTTTRSPAFATSKASR